MHRRPLSHRGGRVRGDATADHLLSRRTAARRARDAFAARQPPSAGFYFRVLTKGQVQAGDEIVRIYDDPRRLSVADVDALLYLPDGDKAAIRTAATIPALSPGWKESFQEMVAGGQQQAPSAPATEPSPPGWTGFAPLRVVSVKPETDTVTSVYLAAADDAPLPPAEAGQYLTVRLPVGAQPVIRTYSLSSAPGADVYRLSVKRESHGVGSTYLTSKLAEGQVIEVAAPRGEFVLTDDSAPVVLLSAGIGVTPVLAMLHELVQKRSQQDVWWISAARTPAQHPLAREAHDLLDRLAHSHENLFYSAEGERAVGRFAVPPPAAIRRDCLPLRAPGLHDRYAGRTRSPRVLAFTHSHRALRRTGCDQSRHRRRRCSGSPTRHRHQGRARWSRSAEAGCRSRSRPRWAACWRWLNCATSRPAGHAGRGCATPARRHYWQAAWLTRLTLWSRPPKGKCSCAAAGRLPTSSLTCSPPPDGRGQIERLSTSAMESSTRPGRNGY